MKNFFSEKFIFSLIVKNEKPFDKPLRIFLFSICILGSLQSFIVASKFLSDTSFCHGASIITATTDACETSTQKSQFIKTIQLFKEGDYEAVEILRNNTDHPIKRHSLNPQNWSKIFGGNNYYYIFMVIWFFAVTKFVLFTDKITNDDDLKAVFGEPLDDKSKRSILNKFEDIYYLLPLPSVPITIIFILGLFISFYEAKAIILSYPSPYNLPYFLLSVIMAPKILFIMLLLFLPTIPGIFIKQILKKEEDWIMIETLEEHFSSVEDIISQEESLVLEFKSSFQTPFPKKPTEIKDKNNEIYYSLGGHKRYKSLKEIEKLLQDMVLETLVGFLNSSGGVLVIGINERDNKKEIVGIDFEGFSSQDSYERHIIQIIINRIGINYMGDYISTEFVNSNGENIFLIKIKPFRPKKGQIPVLLDGKTCFKRTGPRTDRIQEGIDFAEFVAQRVARS